jgi:ribosomal-protein-alanine N-acetyltransferase
MSARLAPVPEPGELEVVVGPLRRRHLRGVLRIEQQVYPRPWSMGLFMSELGYRTGRVYLVARVGTTIVGYGGLMLVQEDGHITTLAVDPAWQRHKIGTRLLLALSEAAVAQGASHLTLEVRISNRPAQELYRQFGFAPAGIRKGYYVETNEDALVMWSHDVDTDDHRARLNRVAATIAGTTVREELDR